MTTLAASRFQPAPARVTAIGRDPNGGNFQEVFRIPGSMLPANGTYQFVVFGRVGDVVLNSDQPFLWADLMLGNSIGGFFTTARHLVSLADLSIRRDFDPQRGFPFFLMVKVAGWTTGDDLVLYARVYDETTFPPLEATFAVAQVGILAFNLTSIGAANHIAEEQTPGSTTLNYYAAGRQTLATSAVLPWISGTEDWAVFWTARVFALEPTNPYGIAIQGWDTIPLWTWGDFGNEGPHGGCNLRGLNPTAATAAGYSLGGFTVQQVTTNATILRLIGRCRYDVGARAVYMQGRWFAVRLSVFHEWESTQTETASGYCGHFFDPRGVVDDKVLGSGHKDAIWLSAMNPRPTDRRRHYHTRLKHNETREQNAPERLFVSQGHAPVEGLYEIAGGRLDLHESNNFFDHETTQRPVDSISLLHFVGTITSPPFRAGETVRGLTSGATIENFEARDNTGPKSLRYTHGSRVGTFTPGETVQGDDSGARCVLRTSPIPEDEPPIDDAWYRTFLVFDPNDEPPPDAVLSEVLGPDVVYVPGREGPSLASLSSLPFAPSGPIEWEVLHDRIRLTSILGHEVSIPRFASVRRRALFRIAGLTAAAASATLQFLRTQQIAAFKYADLDGPERAFVCEVDSIRSTDEGVLKTVTFAALELVWLP